MSIDVERLVSISLTSLIGVPVGKRYFIDRLDGVRKLSLSGCGGLGQSGIFLVLALEEIDREDGILNVDS